MNFFGKFYYPERNPMQGMQHEIITRQGIVYVDSMINADLAWSIAQYLKKQHENLP